MLTNEKQKSHNSFIDSIEQSNNASYHTEDDVIRAVQLSRKAQTEWQKIPIRQRGKYILKIRDYIKDNADIIAEIISKDNGKTRIDALTTEVLPAAIAANYYAKNATKFLKPEKLHSSSWILSYKRSVLVRQPFGVIGIISPWNYPFSIPFSEVIMALLAGNGVILKVASTTQTVGQILKKCIESSGIPEHLFQYVHLPGSKAGHAFFKAGIDKLFFTGSTSTGKKLMELASRTLTPLSLELGGNDPMIVLEDANIDRAVRGAIWAGMQNAGQSCGGIERVYVARKIYHTFLQKLKQEVEQLRVGTDTDFNVDIGRITTEKQLHTIQTHVKDAIEKGAKVYAQTPLHKNAEKQLYPPTVLVNVNHEMLVMREETFGPVVGVMPFDSIEEAINLANDSFLGLTASIWSKDTKKAMKIAQKLQSGVITINDHLMSHGLPETPWGGFKQSSIGRTHGKLGFDEMTQPQVIVYDLFSFLKRQLWWHPFDESLYNGLRSLLQLLYGNFIQKIKALPLIIKILPRLWK